MPGESGGMEVPDDVKQFLRSILISKKGVKQSKIEHDYRELVGENLPWKKIGFKNLFEFLMSVPDVAKLEWREKDEENRVFAVLDNSCFNSVHAKRMAERGFGQGSKPLSPSEIAEWKAKKNQTGAQGVIHHSNSAPSILKSSNNVNSSQAAKVATVPSNNKNASRRNGTKNKLQKGELSDDQKRLLSKYEDQLNPNPEGTYALCIKVSLVDMTKPFPPENVVKEAIRVHLSQPGHMFYEIRFMPRGTMAFVRFRKKFDAAYVIEKKDNTEFMGLNFSVQPAIEKNAGKQKVMEKPNSGLLPTPQTCLIGGQPFTLLAVNPVVIDSLPQQVSPLLPTPKCTPVHMQAASTEQASRQQVNMQAASLQNGFPQSNTLQNGFQQATSLQNGFQQTAGLQNFNTQPANPEHLSSITASEKDVGMHSAKIDKDTVKHPDINNSPSSSQTHHPEAAPMVTSAKHDGKHQTIECAAKEVQVETINVDCWLNYPTMERLFQMSCRRKPKNAADFPDRITFIITFALDACRFWIQRSDFEESCRKMNEKLRNELEKAEPRGNVFPSKNHFGAAKFHEDGMWYRCWVLDSNKEKDEIRVYFCDYGNIEVISGNSFVHINMNYWVMPPQGIQAMLHGFEQKKDLSEILQKQGADVLNELCTGKLLEAETVKQQNSSEPHIIELKNLSVPGLEKDSLESVLLKKGIVVRKEAAIDDDKSNISEDVTKSRVIDMHADPSRLCPSLFECQPDNLIIVQVLAVESPHLFYLKTHESDERLAEINQLLASYTPEEKAEATIGSKVCLKEESGNMRVIIVDLSCNFMYSKKVLVFNPDSGQKIWADSDDLYVLSQELKDIPDVALSAALAGIETKTRVTNATSIIRKRINQDSFARIIGENSSGKLFVELFDDNMSCSINLEVVQRGLARIVRGGPFGLQKDFRSPPRKNSAKTVSDSRRSSISSIEVSPKSSTSSNIPLSPNPFGAGTNFGANCSGEFNNRQSQSSQIRPSNNQVPLKTKKNIDFTANRKQHWDARNAMSDGNISDSSICNDKVHIRLKPLHFKNGEWNEESDNQKSNNVDYLDCQGDYGSSSSLNDSEKDDFNVTPPNPHDKEMPKQQNSEMKFSDTKPRFRPSTPPLPDLIEIDPPVKEMNKEMKLSKTLLSLMNIKAKDAGLNEFVRFKADGSLDRELVQREVERWNAEKELLERHQATMNEVLALPDDKMNAQLIKNQRKRFLLLVKKSECEERLAEVTKELNKLKNEINS